MPPDEIVEKAIERAKRKEAKRKSLLMEGLTPEEKRTKIINEAKVAISNDIGASGLISEKNAKEVAGEVVNNYVSKLYKGKDVVLELQKEGKEDTRTGYHFMKLADKIRTHSPQQDRVTIQKTKDLLEGFGYPVTAAGEKVFRDTKIVVSLIPLINEFYPGGVDLLVRDARDNITKKYRKQTTTTTYPTK